MAFLAFWGEFEDLQQCPLVRLLGSSRAGRGRCALGSGCSGCIRRSCSRRSSLGRAFTRSLGGTFRGMGRAGCSVAWRGSLVLDALAVSVVGHIPAAALKNKRGVGDNARRDGSAIRTRFLGMILGDVGAPLFEDLVALWAAIFVNWHTSFLPCLKTGGDHKNSDLGAWPYREQNLPS